MNSSFKINPMLATDSYKLSHKQMYSKGTTKIYSNLTPRSGKIIERIVPISIYDSKVVVFGLQGLLKHWTGLWEEEFFSKSQTEAVSHFAKTVKPFIGDAAVDVEGVVNLWKLGYLPLRIKALPEGSVVPYKVAVLTITNTLPEFFWLTNYVETYLSNEYWKASTNATIARYYRKLLTSYAQETGAPLEFVDFQAHDFSCRGMSGMHDAATSGAGHLVFFKGSDTVVAADYIRYAYDGDMTPLIAASVPASEHSVMVQEGKEGEFNLIKRLITEEFPNGIISLVIDGFDYWNVLSNYIPKLKEEILARGSDSLGNSKVVLRPDSSDPFRIVCGRKILDADNFTREIYGGTESGNYKQLVRNITDEREKQHYDEENLTLKFDNVEQFIEHRVIDEDVIKYNGKYYIIDGEGDSWDSWYSLGKEISEAEAKGSIQILWDTFGGEVNEKGYKVLNPKVGLIYGDSITLERAEQILEGLKDKGFASSNIVFGVGSFTYQCNTRDTLGYAIKATYSRVNGEDRNLFKEPKTDDGTKKSAKGLIAVFKNAEGEYQQIDEVCKEMEEYGELNTVFLNGFIVNETNFEEVRSLAIQSL